MDGPERFIVAIATVAIGVGVYDLLKMVLIGAIEAIRKWGVSESSIEFPSSKHVACDRKPVESGPLAGATLESVRMDYSNPVGRPGWGNHGEWRKPPKPTVKATSIVRLADGTEHEMTATHHAD